MSRSCVSRLLVVLAVTSTLTTAAGEAAAAIERGALSSYRVERRSDGSVRAFAPLGRVCHEGSSAEESARHFLGREAAILGMAPDLAGLELLRVQQSLAGQHVRFVQTWRGLPVWGSSLSVHLDGGQCLSRANVRVAALDRLATDPAVTAAEASDAAVAAIAAEPIGKGHDKVGPRARRAQLQASGGRFALGDAPQATLVVYSPPGSAAPRLAWHVLVQVLSPYGKWDVLVDALDGRVLERRDVLRYAVDGTGQVFLPNACIALRTAALTDQADADSAVPPAAYSTVPLLQLNDAVGGVYRLAGPFVSLTEIELPTIAPPTSPTPDFVFTRSPDGFEAASIYYHLDTTQRYIQSLGFIDVNNRSIPVDAHGFNGADNSRYDPTAGDLAFGDGGVDDGEDGDVVYHEYGHAIQDNQVPGWGQTLEGGSMGEAFGDYLAGTMHAEHDYENECVAMWDATSYSGDNPPCLRRLDSPKHYPEDVAGEVHADGEIWSAALWQCHNQIGRDTFNRILLESHFSVPPDGDFADGVQALFDADQALFGGVHQGTICAVMSERGFLSPFAFQASTIDDAAPGGDADGFLEPGENAVVRATIRNPGALGLTGVSAILTSDQPAYVGISRASATFPDLPGGATAASDAPHFQVSVLPSAPCGTRVTFTLTVTASECAGTLQFTVILGRAAVGAPVSGSYTGPAIPIPDDDPGGISSSIVIAGPGQVTSVSCTVGITHPYIGDLQVTLESPTGTQVVLHNQTGDQNDNIRTTFPVPTAPDGPGTMADFSVEPAAGTWRLLVSDNAFDDEGTLDSWSLDIGTGTYTCDFTSVPCASTTQVGLLKAVKTTAGTRVRLEWAPIIDTCHASCNVYRTTASGMRPGTPPGTWPTDPAFTNITASDTDGTATDNDFEYAPGATDEFFQVVDVGTNGTEGPVGSFGR